MANKTKKLQEVAQDLGDSINALKDSLDKTNLILKDQDKIIVNTNSLLKFELFGPISVEPPKKLTEFGLEKFLFHQFYWIEI